MSQYIQFFIKGLNSDFLPIGNFSKICSIFTAFDDFCPFVVPYGNVAPVTIMDLTYVRNGLESKIKEVDQKVVEVEKTITIIAGCNNSIEDKLEEIHNLNSDIEEWLNIKAELQSSEGYIASLEEIIDSVAWDSRYDENKYLYCGIEVGEEPEEQNK
jgi:hypothetical protein